MMNCAELFHLRALDAPQAPALYSPSEGQTSFGELRAQASTIQGYLEKEGLRPGHSVLLVDFPGSRLFATVIAVLGVGATVILVEPWMPVAGIERAIGHVKPAFFVGNLFGRLWGMRVPAVRAIPRRLAASRLGEHGGNGRLRLEKLDESTPGVISFTTGTTGRPKGVVRTHGYLTAQYRVFSRALELERWKGADLCIFANFALANLAAGRASVLVPSNWKPAALRRLDDLPPWLRPDSLSCGPAFLGELMRHARLPSLKSVHVGGALIDTALFEAGFERWPGAHWLHVYGSSEAEPVAVSDAREAVRRSRERGFFQTLHLGRPASELRYSIEGDETWITGPHVCPAYVGNAEESARNKRTDTAGNVWHQMGDRVHEDAKGNLWYGGRSQQNADDFNLEQAVYSYLESSAAFVARSPDGRRHLLGEGLKSRRGELCRRFPEFASVREARIYRDRRHRARIDRPRSLHKAPAGKEFA